MEASKTDNKKPPFVIYGQYDVKIIEEEGLVLKKNKLLNKVIMEKHFLLNQQILFNWRTTFIGLINEANLLVTDIANGNNIMVSNISNDICFIDLDSAIDIHSFEKKTEKIVNCY